MVTISGRQSAQTAGGLTTAGGRLERWTVLVMVHSNNDDSRSHTLDERQEKYLNWLLTPKGDRVPASQAQYCRENNVDPTTVRRWEKKEFFRREWQSRVDDLQGSPERTQQLLDALYNKAIGGDTRAANLYLQATHRLTPPPSAETTAARSMAELSNDELDQLILDAAKKERELRNLKVV